MRRFWLFRNLTNFTVGTLAISLTGYYFMGIYNERKFEVPIIDQSVVLLNRNHEIKQLAGTPISYVSGSNSSAVVTGEGAFYVFNFSGPNARLMAEMTGECKTFEEFTQSKAFKKAESLVLSLESEQQAALQHLEQVQAQLSLAKPKSKEHAALQQQTKDAELRLKLVTDDLAEKQQERAKLLRKFHSQYYIPDKQHAQELEERAKSDEEVPANWKMWSITRLVADLPNGNKVFVVPRLQESEPSRRETVPNEEKGWTYKSLHDRLDVATADLTPEELSAYSKHKTQMLYSKHGSHRATTLVGGFLLMGGVIFYYLKNRIIPLNNSIFLRSVQQMFEKHPRIRQRGRYTWSNVVKGGRRGNDVDVAMDVSGEIKGQVHVLAKYNEKKDEYTFTKVEFSGFDKDRKQLTIDLLKV